MFFRNLIIAALIAVAVANQEVCMQKARDAAQKALNDCKVASSVRVEETNLPATDRHCTGYWHCFLQGCGDRCVWLHCNGAC